MPVGRPRKTADRTPSGHLSRALQNNRLVVQAQRAKPDVLRALGHPELGSPIGRMYLLGEIPAPSFAAAQKFEQLDRAYLAATDSPSPDAKAIDLNRVAGKRLDADMGDAAQRDAAVIAAFDGVKSVLVKSQLDALRDVVTRGLHPVTYEQKRDAISACLTLSRLWRLAN